VEGAEMCMMKMSSMKWCMIKVDVTEHFYDDSRDEQSAA
jgi:hypothetical protein